MVRQARLTKIQYLFLALVLLCTLFIWGNSLFSRETSKQQSKAVEEYVEPVLDAIKVPPSNRQHFVRKSAHLIEFFVLGLLWTCLWKGRHLYWAFLACLLTASADEMIQMFAPGRGPQFSDVLLDFSGSAAAIVLLGLIILLVRRICCRDTSDYIRPPIA